jgi:ParB/RepB/Spo0J family partition protein
MYQKIELSNISPNLQNARKSFKNIQRLANSIASVGLQHPITVRPSIEEGKYVIVAGERRFRACQLLQWNEVDCKVEEYDPATAELAGLVENIERQNLTAKEKTAKILELRTSSHLSNRSLAKEVGVSESYIRKLLKLDNLAPEIKEKIEKKEISQATGLKMAGNTHTHDARLFPTDTGETKPSIASDVSEHVSESQQDECTNVTVANPGANESAQAVPLKAFEKLIVQIDELSRQLNIDDAFLQSLSGKHLQQFTDLLGNSMQRIDGINERLQDEINEREYKRRGIPETSMTAQQDSLPAA